MKRLRKVSVCFNPPKSSRASRSTAQEEPDHIDTLESLIKLLQRPAAQRSLKSLHSLVEFVKEIKFFRQLVGDLSEDAVVQCCLNMTYQRADKGEVRFRQFVFRQGDQGSKFFIVLEGKIGVYIETLDEQGNKTIPQVATLGKGDSFGELALLNNKPRAATIGCMSECHFAVLEKTDYVRILSKLHEAKMLEKVDFLLSLPIFRKWTRGSIQKLTFYFKERTYSRKQVVCKAGDPATDIHLIRHGEVEVLKEQLTRTQVAAFRSPKTLTTFAELAILGTGESIGHEEAIAGITHRFTYLCHSCTARILSISREDFLKRVNTEESWNFLKTLTAVKGDLRQQRISSLESLEQIRRDTAHSRADSAFSLVLEQSQTPPALSRLGSNEPSPVHKKNVVSLDTVARLYPFRPAVREVGATSKSNAIKDFRRLKSWDVLITRKAIDLRNKFERRKKERRSFVNIHTQRLKTPGNSPRSGHFLSFATRLQRMNSHRNSTVASSKPCLTINSIEMVSLNSRDEASPSPDCARIHSRLKRYSSAETLPKFDGL